MNTLDIILLVPILFGLVKGLWSGLIQELAGIAGLIAGIVAGLLFAPALEPLLQSHLSLSPNSANVLSFILLFVIGFIVVLIVAKFLSKGVSMVALGPVNRGLGGVFGAAKYALFTVLILSAFNRINSAVEIVDPQALEESVVYSGLVKSGSWLWRSIPPEGEIRNSIPHGFDARK